ncbi:hypothetical protein O0I10_007349 [Lichtheimia ornata]|uniref:Proteasome inhibitor PI31 subunit n=1 Tax=Lichtheimia ornata TaxID=688661 RepID=A0AAD7V2F1_9FUNG|nr:uncharacterized protein O0I10_007349 [Lichtheimia ornata]KAJ8657015.1 hypothetical protein O0I10_007349 [Lichtheimia ornata]
MSNNSLDPASILHTLAQITPGTLQNPYDALAAATHAIMLSIGCKFAGLGDDARQEGDGTVRALPQEWNSNGPHHYAFRYSHPQSSMTFVIKSIRLGDRWICHGIGIEDNKTATLDIVTSQFTSAAFFPHDPSTSQEPLIHGFISTSQFQEFISLFKINILQRILPGLQKEGYDNSGSSSQQQQQQQQPPSSSSTTQPQRRDPPPFRPPLFEDPISADDPSSFDPSNPFSVGRSDLEPMGGGLRMPGSGGGMFVGPEHPMFRARRDEEQSPFSGEGPQRLPRGAVPPGARFDPITPTGGGAGMRPPRGPRGGFFSGEPDNDELPPPGSHDMFL